MVKYGDTRIDEKEEGRATTRRTSRYVFQFFSKNPTTKQNLFILKMVRSMGLKPTLIASQTIASTIKANSDIEMVRVVGFEPTSSQFQTEPSDQTDLHPDMAAPPRIELGSSDRQSDIRTTGL